MSGLIPTRVSLYDFLYEDTKPLVPLLADIAQLSIPQTRLALTDALQAIVTGLLTLEQNRDGDAIKKLLTRSSVKDLRQYNAMNFVTLAQAYQLRQNGCDALFANSNIIKQICTHIASLIDADPNRLQILLATLTIITLRELAILVDYAQLNGEEIHQWFQLQPQFLTAQRFCKHQLNVQQEPEIEPSLQLIVGTLTSPTTTEPNYPDIIHPPTFDPFWYELLEFKIPELPTNNPDTQHHDLPHYAKVIGRTADKNDTENTPLYFDKMQDIYLPTQRWLLQLAKISDIYLSRNRLKITSEPPTPPSRPLIDFGLNKVSEVIDKPKQKSTQNSTQSSTSSTPITYETPAPMWKNPVILAVIIIISILAGLAFIKYKNQQKKLAENLQKQQIIDLAHPPDIAIVRIDKTDEKEKTNKKSESKKTHGH